MFASSMGILPQMNSAVDFTLLLFRYMNATEGCINRLVKNVKHADRSAGVS